MALFDNMNMTTSAGVAPGVVDYYERTLVENARPEMVHGRDAQKRTLPEHNGKHVQFRRMIPYEACTEPLKEGVTPAGQEIKQTAFTAMVKPYSRHHPARRARARWRLAQPACCHAAGCERVPCSHEPCGRRL